MFDITALGEILIDFTPVASNDEKNVFEQNAGGAPANLLAAFSRFGGKAAFIGKVGADLFGDFLTQTLKKNRIDTSGLCVDKEHNTTLAFVALDRTGDRHFSFCRNFGADVFLTQEEVNANLIKNSKIFHFGSLSLTNEPSRSATDYALSVAKESGCIITFDPNYREPLWKSEKAAIDTISQYIDYADIIKFSKEEIEMLTGEGDTRQAAKAILAKGVKLVLVTDGPNGVLFATKRFIGFVPSMKVKAVDTTGAGDIFFGTFLYVLSREKIEFDHFTAERIANAVKLAVKASGLSTTKKGAIPSIPEYKEIFDA